MDGLASWASGQNSKVLSDFIKAFESSLSVPNITKIIEKEKKWLEMKKI